MRRQWLTHREVWRELDLEGVESWRAEQDALKEEQAAQQSPSEGTQAEGHDAEVPLGATATAGEASISGELCRQSRVPLTRSRTGRARRALRVLVLPATLLRSRMLRQMWPRSALWSFAMRSL